MQETNREQWDNGAEVFLILRDQKLIQASRHAPDSFYVKGIIEEGQFTPKSDVLGVGDLGKAGRYGWLELGSKEFHAMESDKKAQTPFVKGYITEKGFVPSMREVFREP